MLDEKKNPLESKQNADEIKYPEIKLAKLDKTIFIKHCDFVRDKLISLMIEAADRLYEPLIDLDIHETDMGEYYLLLFKCDQYFIRSRNVFANVLKTNGALYRHNIQDYIRYLHNHRLENKPAIDLQRQALFQSPKIVAGHYYQNVDSFSLIEEDEDFYNFNPLLQLIFNLEFLKLEIQDGNYSLEEITRLNDIHSQVNQFEILLQAGNENRLRNYLIINNLDQKPLLPSSQPINDYPFLTGKVFNSLKPYGDPSLGHWESFKAEFLWQEMEDHSLQRFWQNGVFSFLLGIENVNSLKSKILWLEDSLYLIAKESRKIIQTKRLNLISTFRFVQFIFDFCFMLTQTIPMQILFGLLNLPMRLLLIMDYYLSGEGIIRQILSALFEIPIMILFVLTITLSFLTACALSIVTFPLSIFAGVVATIIYPPTMLLTTYVFNPIFNFFANGIKSFFNITPKDLLLKLSQEMVKGKYQQCWLPYKNSLFTLRPLQLYFINYDKNPYIKEFSKIISNQNSFTFYFASGKQNKPNGMHFIFGKDNLALTNTFNQLKDSKEITNLYFNWRFYPKQNMSPSAEDMQHIIQHLTSRTIPIDKMDFEMNDMDDDTLRSVVDALIGNSAVNPHTISLKIDNLTNEKLVLLQQLADRKSSIQNIFLIKETLPNTPEFLRNFNHLGQLLARNRQEAAQRSAAFLAFERQAQTESKLNLSGSPAAASLSGNFHTILATPRSLPPQTLMQKKMDSSARSSWRVN